MRWRFSGEGLGVEVDEGRWERIWEAERGELRAFWEMIFGIWRRTIAFKDIGTEIMLASSRIASRALFRDSEVSSGSAMFNDGIGIGIWSGFEQ